MMINYCLNLSKKLCDYYHIDWKFVKFLFVGGINTLFGYGVFALFIWFGLHYGVANFFSIVLGIIFNFFTTGYFVFSNTNKKLFWRFLAVYSINWSISTSIMYVCKLCNYNNLYIIGAILLLPMAFLSFLLMKYFVFNRRPE